MAIEDFRRIVESLRAAVLIADREATIVFANAEAAQCLGASAASLVGTSLAGHFDEADRKRIMQSAARIGEGKSASTQVESRLASPERSGRAVKLTLQPAFGSRDEVTGVVAIVHDIEARRETDAALARAGTRLLALAEAAPQAVLIEGLGGEVELANDAFCRLLGLQSAHQSLTGLPVREVLVESGRVEGPAVDRASARAEAAEVAVRGEAGAAFTLLRQPLSSDDRPAGALWISREGAPAGAPVVSGGASEVALIERIGEELSVALEGIAAISIRAQQMEVDPALVEHFQTIRLSTETAMAAIGDLVDFSKVSGGVILRKGEFGLRSALAELIKRVSAEAEERGCRLRMRVEQDVADRLEGDVARLQLVLRNLLDNAFHLSPKSVVSLQVVPEYVTESGIQLSFSIATAAEGSEKPALAASPDSGMSVAVARFMVAAMGGKLAVSTRPSDPLYAFTIEFPVKPAHAAPKRKSYDTLAGMPVLVVSGDSGQRLAVANVVRGWQMVPMEADNAAMALALMERMHEERTPVPLLIVTDELPVQDGYLLAFRVKHHPSLGGTLVMMLASKGRPGDAIACRENGISAYMRYPISDRQLNEAIVAVTGASVGSEDAPTLVTRHSLRESRKGASVLLVEASRENQIQVAHVLGKRECTVAVATNAKEALAALEQDLHDIVIVDASLPGLDMPSTPAKLRAAIQRDAAKVRLIASTLDHTPAWSAARKAEGYDGSIGKPFNRDQLLALLD
jgi:PAS domain S-box-containing protein